jgi:hypothetical protein
VVTKRSEILFAILGVFALGTAVDADMMPVSGLDAGHVQAACGRVQTDPLDSSSSSLCPGWPVTGGLDSLALGSSLHVDADAGQAGVTQPVQVLHDDQSSLSLCLYALMGFGLCRSAPWVKKLHFGTIPQWYHDGGPAQVGHSLAISPDCLCHAPACCFVQPDGMADPHIPRYHFATVVARWRNSQFTPAVLAARAPPLRSF